MVEKRGVFGATLKERKVEKKRLAAWRGRTRRTKNPRAVTKEREDGKKNKKTRKKVSFSRPKWVFLCCLPSMHGIWLNREKREQETPLGWMG